MAKKAKRTSEGGGTTTGQEMLPDEDNHLDAIREILVGSQQRTSDKKFERLEVQIAEDFNNLKNEVAKYMEALESRLETEIQSVLSQIGAEKTTRKEMAHEIKQMIVATIKTFEEKLKQSNRETIRTQKILEKQTSDQFKRLDAEFLNRHSGLVEDIVSKDKKVGRLLRSESKAFQEMAVIFEGGGNQKGTKKKPN